jgi:hypothetical protein
MKKVLAKPDIRGIQYQLSIKLSNEEDTDLDPRSISAKVSNFKSLAGVNNSSNYSYATEMTYNKYNHMSIKELKSLLINADQLTSFL